MSLSTVNDVIRIKGAKFIEVGDGKHYYLNLYNDSKTFLKGLNTSNNGHAAYDATGSAFAYDETTGVTTIDLAQTNFKVNNTAPTTAYFRINAYGKGADLIVTVNQEIT